MAKKVLIITLPLGANYGGMMQAYALQQVIRRMGFEVTTTWYDASQDKVSYLYNNLLRKVKVTIKRLLGQPVMSDFYHYYHTDQTQTFLDQAIQVIPFKEAVSNVDKGLYAGLVVGSDQVWRNAYTAVAKNLLDFAPHHQNKISYAASFGHDDINDYPSQLIQKTADLAKSFKAISVREKSGLDIVRRRWGRSAQQHVDPTLLLQAEDYNKLIAQFAGQNKLNLSGKIFAYVLDQSSHNKDILDDVALILDKDIVEIMPSKATSFYDLRTNPSQHMLPPVTDWLSSLQSADFVITDSFHGVAFSIIFQRPFVAIGNTQRGLARFQSILDIFGLSDRLVANKDDLKQLVLDHPIDWQKISSIRHQQIDRSVEYLQSNLKP